MKRPVMVHPDTVKVASALASTMGPGVKAGDVLGFALDAVVTMLAAIDGAGLGTEPVRGDDLLAKYIHAVRVTESRAARTREIRA